MYYGYGPHLKDYDPEKVWELANALAAEFDYPTMDGQDVRPLWVHSGANQKEPYIEVNGLGSGVLIRRITYLTDAEHAGLIEKADAIYRKVMG